MIRARAGLAAGATLVAGCLMTATVPELGAVSEARPFILRDAVDPRPERILTALPERFLVPVSVDGPTATFQWRVYVDLDRKAASASSGTLFEIAQKSEAEPLSAEAIRRIRFTLDRPASVGSGCTLVQMFVAREFDDRRFPTTPAAAGPPDIVSWLVATGPNGCEGVAADAGVDASAPDAAPSPDAATVNLGADAAAGRDAN
jgi:hypothetical protein